MSKCWKKIWLVLSQNGFRFPNWTKIMYLWTTIVNHQNKKNWKLVVEVLLQQHFTHPKSTLHRDQINSPIHKITSATSKWIWKLYTLMTIINNHKYSILYTILSLEFNKNESDLTEEEKEYNKLLQDKKLQSQLIDIVIHHIMKKLRINHSNTKRTQSLQILERIFSLLGKYI